MSGRKKATLIERFPSEKARFTKLDWAKVRLIRSTRGSREEVARNFYIRRGDIWKEVCHF